MTKKHILVTGPHRSGTTWLGKTLSQPEEIELVYEPFNPDFVRYNFDYTFDYWFEHVPTSKKQIDIERYIDQYIPNNGFQHARKVCRESGNSFKSPLIFCKKLLLSHKRPRYLLKDPIALLSAGWLYERYNFLVICITRKPLAFVGSLKKQGWDFDFNNILCQERLVDEYLPKFKKQMKNVQNNGDFIDRAALLWNVLNTIILQYKEKYSGWYFTTHEDVALNSHVRFKEMYEYVELPFTAEIENYIKEYTSDQNPGEAKSHQYQPRDAERTLDSWKNRLTDIEMKKVIDTTQSVYNKLYPNG